MSRGIPDASDEFQRVSGAFLEYSPGIFRDFQGVSKAFQKVLVASHGCSKGFKEFHGCSMRFRVVFKAFHKCSIGL